MTDRALQEPRYLDFNAVSLTCQLCGLGQATYLAEPHSAKGNMRNDSAYVMGWGVGTNRPQL